MTINQGVKKAGRNLWCSFHVENQHNKNQVASNYSNYTAINYYNSLHLTCLWPIERKSRS